MTPQQWDAHGYDRRFSYVTAYGADLLSLLDPRPGERILDLGCGTGHQAAQAAAAGAQVVGVDADDAMLQVARATYPELTFQPGDGQDLDVPTLCALVGGRYDAVLSNAALHWMPRQDDVIAGVAALLRPGGRLVVEMGGTGNVTRLTAAIRTARTALGLTDRPTPWTFPSPAEQAARLERAGFTVRLVQLFERTTPLAPGDSAADWAAMFGAGLVADVPPQLQPEFAAALDAAAAGLGLDRHPDGEPGWWADYVRLRFVAECDAGSG
jgi:trans-aconitate methyltransferase